MAEVPLPVVIKFEGMEDDAPGVDEPKLLLKVVRHEGVGASNKVLMEARILHCEVQVDTLGLLNPAVVGEVVQPSDDDSVVMRCKVHCPDVGQCVPLPVGGHQNRSADPLGILVVLAGKDGVVVVADGLEGDGVASVGVCHKFGVVWVLGAELLG